jgi:hypothetical protein
MDWQPIETAPKDRTDVLLTDGYNVAVAYWDEASWPNASENSKWSISDWHNDPIYLRGGYAAKFWMPLPEPPPLTHP